jgi:hypothetical protein
VGLSPSASYYNSFAGTIGRRVKVLEGGDANGGCGGFGAAENEKAAENRGFSMLEFLEETGAGEAIRTLDPNLGKVVLYP